MKVVKRLLIFILILVVLLFALVFGVVYMGVNDAHEPYVGLIEKYSKEYSLDEALVASVIKVESDFRPEIKSDAGAVGLMQLLPDTAKWVADRLGEEYSSDKLTDPETNIRYGTYYFKYLLNHFKSEDFAILAYNGGMGNVDSWIKDGLISGFSGDYSKVPIQETRSYIKKVKDTHYLYSDIYFDYMKDTKSSKFVIAFKMYIDLLTDIIRK